MAFEQSLWRMVHGVGAEKALSTARLADLRSFAADRARNQPFAVFEQDGVRPSFRLALAHAADELATGREVL